MVKESDPLIFSGIGHPEVVAAEIAHGKTVAIDGDDIEVHESGICPASKSSGPEAVRRQEPKQRQLGGSSGISEVRLWLPNSELFLPTT